MSKILSLDFKNCPFHNTQTQKANASNVQADWLPSRQSPLHYTIQVVQIIQVKLKKVQSLFEIEDLGTRNPFRWGVNHKRITKKTEQVCDFAGRG